jgi:hypothetical protein
MKCRNHSALLALDDADMVAADRTPSASAECRVPKMGGRWDTLGAARI